MKIYLLFIPLFFTTGIEIPQNPIYSKWQLVKIEVDQQTLTPEKVSYFLNITETSISYNLEVNNCWAGAFSLNENQLNIEGVACTKVCCDGRSDSISNYINYRGNYELQENELIIASSKSTLYLRRLDD